METYGEHIPTEYDRHIVVEDREDWLIAPVSINRDTADAVTLSNWEVLQEILDDQQAEYEIHRFGHWSYGWYEMILVNPIHAELLQTIYSRLDSYPILNDEKWSEKETEHEWESWEGYVMSDLTDKIECLYDCEIGGENGYITYEQFEQFREAAGVDWRHGQDGASIDLDAIAQSVDIDELDLIA